MNWFDFSEASVGERVVAAIVVLLCLGGIAAALVVFSMMMVLFGVDSGQNTASVERMLPVVTKLVVGSLAVATLLPPLLLLMRFSPGICLLPAAVGFTSAGLCTLLLVIRGVAH